MTLYADIYPSGHKSIVSTIAELVASGKMPPMTGVISKHDASNGYWSNVRSCTKETVLVEPPLTKAFYRKDIDDVTGELIVQRKVKKKHMPHEEFWGEIVEASIAEALRKPTKGEAIISPIIDTYTKDSILIKDLKENPYAIKTGHDLVYARFNQRMTEFVVKKTKGKKDERKIFAGLFLDSDIIRDPAFLDIVDSYKEMKIHGYFLVMQDITFDSSLERLLALKGFIERLKNNNPERKIVLYRTGMLGALYAAIFPDIQIGCTYGLPYRDSYNIRNINPAKETRPLKSSKLIYSPVLLNTVKIQDALKAWAPLETDLDAISAKENHIAMVKMAELTQGLVHKLNVSTDAKVLLAEHVKKGIACAAKNRVLRPYATHLIAWKEFLERV